MTAAPETILAYSGLELMGDGFMKIPFLRALRGTWPQARITWLAGAGRTVYFVVAWRVGVCWSLPDTRARISSARACSGA